MKKSVVYFICTFCFALTLHAETLGGRVVGVTDGDTVKLLDITNTIHVIRLAGIDAPEKTQAFGTASKKTLSDLVFDENVLVDYYKYDRYGRKIGKITIDGVDINLEQVKLGMAWHYKKYKSEQTADDRLRYLHAQNTAKSMRLGLWVDNEPIAPWAFRKSR